MIKKKNENKEYAIEDKLYRNNFESMTPTYRTSLMPREILARRAYLINNASGPKSDLDDCIIERHELLMRMKEEYKKDYKELTIKLDGVLKNGNNS